MSCNYAEGLSPYEYKGVLGIPEEFDSPEKFEKKCQLLAELISSSKHVVVHTGAGISTSAGIPDFRGPNGVWTLEKEGRKPNVNISFTDAKPTKTHMILKHLVERQKVQYIISQNIDGLHLKSGLSRDYLAELHGNMFIDECNFCNRQFVRSTPVETVGKRSSGALCLAGSISGRPCRGRLHDGVLDWEHSLPENDLQMAEWHSSIADLSICLGTTLQIIPSGNLPLETVKYGGKLVICNLQPTKHDNKSDLKISYYVDDILERIMKILNIDIPEYNVNDDPTFITKSTIIEWSIVRSTLQKIEKLFRSKCKGVKKKRILTKKRRNSDDSKNNVKSEEKKVKIESKVACDTKTKARIHKEDKDTDFRIKVTDETKVKSEALEIGENSSNKESMNNFKMETKVKSEEDVEEEVKFEKHSNAFEKNIFGNHCQEITVVD